MAHILIDRHVNLGVIMRSFMWNMRLKSPGLIPINIPKIFSIQGLTIWYRFAIAFNSSGFLLYLIDIHLFLLKQIGCLSSPDFQIVLFCCFTPEWFAYLFLFYSIFFCFYLRKLVLKCMVFTWWCLQITVQVMNG